MTTMAQGYARMHREYLKASNPRLLATLQTSGELTAHLEKVGQDAAQMYDTLHAQMMHDPKLPKDYHARVKALEAIPATVDEIVKHEIVYQPQPKQAA